MDHSSSGPTVSRIGWWSKSDGLGDSGHCFMPCLGLYSTCLAEKWVPEEHGATASDRGCACEREKKGDDLAAAGSHISRFLCSSLVIVL